LDAYRRPAIQSVEKENVIRKGDLEKTRLVFFTEEIRFTTAL
jgi:hypothetical protein